MNRRFVGTDCIAIQYSLCIVAVLFSLVLAACCTTQGTVAPGGMPFRLAYLQDEEHTYMYFRDRVFASYRPGPPQREMMVLTDSVKFNDSILTIIGRVVDAQSLKGVDSVELYVGTYGSHRGTVSQLDGSGTQSVGMYRINDTPYRFTTDQDGTFKVVAHIEPNSKLFVANMNYALKIYYVSRLLAQ